MPVTRTPRTNTTSGVAVGIKRGASGRAILVGGHIDSAGPEIPGANDDGSGSAVVMEACRVLCERPHEGTLIFACWGGEEQGLLGSAFFVEHFALIDSVDLMIQVDMANGLGRIEIDPDTKGASAPSWLVRAALEEYAGLGYGTLAYATHFYSLNYASSASSGSDHESFLEAGIPAVDFTTDVTDPIHTPRDNYENFDPRGLKRSGDLAVRLVERFDGAIPSRSTENYWFYLVGPLPLFLPVWGIWAFAAAALAAAAAAFVRVRRQREPRDHPDRIRWSGLKVWLGSLIAFACAWFLPDLIGLVRGYRHPWMTSIGAYYLLFGLSFLIGLALVAKLTRKLRLARCPHVFFLRAILLLALFLLLFGLLNPKLMMEPSAALLLLALAVFLRPAWLKAALLVLSPVWIVKIFCSEWAPLYYRIFAAQLPARLGVTLLFSAAVIVFASLIALPFLYGALALARLSPPLAALFRRIRTNAFLAVAGLFWLALSGYLLTVPVYDSFWYRNLAVEESYHLERGTKEVSIHSGEYLDGLTISRQGTDSTVTAKRAVLNLEPTAGFDTTWLCVSRTSTRSGDTTSLELTLVCARRPYEVRVSYTPSGDGVIGEFSSSWVWSRRNSVCSLRWYAFPEEVLEIPVRFSAAGADSVTERIEVTFDALADPMTLALDHAYVLPRTTFISEAVYRR
jgi:hypothetical protein